MNEHNVLLNLSSHDLKRAIALKERIENLQAELTNVLGGSGAPAATPVRRKRTMSAAGRARIAAAARARWAKLREGKAVKTPAKRKRKVSAAARARLSALAKARWAKVRKAGKNRL